MRGVTLRRPFAASRAFMPVYLPFSSVPPMMLLVVSASVSPAATRTTTVTGWVWSAMAWRLAAKVPVLPALAIALCTLVSRTGVLSGNAAGSASSAVQTMPTIAVETVRIGRVPSLISTTRTP
ncbi:hypothetical protein D3C78_1225120 [compost metagenome]